jgi:glycosyltransferase involved in cell wall biosynthesis
MRIAIATTQIPFVSGGAEMQAQSLRNALMQRGHQAEVVTIPFKWYPPERIAESIISARLVDLTEVNGVPIDLLIGLKFPAYFFRHANKVAWIIHQHREAYDTWGTEFGGLHLYPDGASVRDMIWRADQTYLKECKRLFAESRRVAQRLDQYNGLSAETLYHPCPNSDQLSNQGDEGYFFYPSRMDTSKRQHLVLEAMALVDRSVRLVIAGGSGTPAYTKRLHDLVRYHHLEERVKILGSISEEQKRDLYSKCRAVIFPPFDEDYGYVTLEAFYSHKPVITCSDSGGPLEFIQSEKTGLVVEPDSEELADALERFDRSKELANEMGEEAYRTIVAKNLSWERIVEELTKE